MVQLERKIEERDSPVVEGHRDIVYHLCERDFIVQVT